jgi:RNA recognition motif-containing protein
VDNRDSNPDTFTQIYVANIYRETGKRDLMEGFGKFGEIKNITLKDHYAFIDFETHDAAVEAIEKMNLRIFVSGEELKV